MAGCPRDGVPEAAPCSTPCSTPLQGAVRTLLQPYKGETRPTRAPNPCASPSKYTAYTRRVCAYAIIPILRSRMHNGIY